MTDRDMITIQEIQLESDSKKGNMVVLKESPEAKRLFMMFVGDAEFAAIAKEKGLFQPKRPLTYELYLGIMEKLEVDFVGVEIAKVQEDTYYAEVVFRVGGVEHRMDSRPSDAVALALNRKIPIKVSAPLFRRQLTQEQIKEFEGLVKTVKF